MVDAARSAVVIGLRSLAISPRMTARVAVACLLALIGLGTLTALGAYRLSFSAPDWWRTVAAQSPGTIALAEGTEQAVTSALHRRRELGEPWTVAVSAPEANAWVNVMLPRWLENRDVDRPEWAREVQLNFEHGSVAGGAKVEDDRGRPRYVTLRAEPVIDAMGALWLQPRGASVGRLSVPLRWTFEEFERRASGDRADLVAAIMGRQPVARSASVSLGDGRVVRITGVRVEEGRLLVTCVTER